MMLLKTPLPRHLPHLPRSGEEGWSPADEWSVNADPGENLLWLLGRRRIIIIIILSVHFLDRIGFLKVTNVVLTLPYYTL